MRFSLTQLDALLKAGKIQGYTELPRKADNGNLATLMQPETKKGNKYGAKKVEIDGIVFDSKKEANRYQELKAEQMAGKVRGLIVHFPFDLVVEGELIAVYEADFVYTVVETEAMIVEDVKSKVTRKLPVYRLKKKLMKALHNIDIQEI